MKAAVRNVGKKLHGETGVGNSTLFHLSAFGAESRATASCNAGVVGQDRPKSLHRRKKGKAEGGPTWQCSTRDVPWSYIVDTSGTATWC